MRDKIAFVGRSNVGKSSTIRRLTGVKTRVGRRPGTTLKPSFIPYGEYNIVDMPGFGFMSGVSEKRQEEIKDFIVHYLEHGEDIAFAVQITDTKAFQEIAERWDKRGMIPVEVEMFHFLWEVSLRPILVCNKMDKVPKEEREKVLEGICSWLEIESGEGVLVPFSAKTGEGVGELKALMRKRIASI